MKHKLSHRIQVNKGYSLRAFARDLRISPSRLSQILNCKAGLSPEKAEVIAKQLDLSQEEQQYFVALVQASDSRSQFERKAAQSKVEHFQQRTTRNVDLDYFKLISDWYHFAIFELIELKGFKNDISWIANTLDISTHEVKLAIERLINLDLIQEENGELTKVDRNINTPHNIPSSAIKEFHKQILNKALMAVDFQSVEERNFGTLTVAVDKEDYHKITVKMKELRSEINAIATKSQSKKDELYLLGTYFFRLSERSK